MTLFVDVEDTDGCELCEPGYPCLQHLIEAFEPELERE